MPTTDSTTPPTSKKLAVGLCAIFLGFLGVHKFLLGYQTAGLIMLLVSTLTCLGAPVMGVVGIIEGITYLTKTEEEFAATYIANKKEWF
jgi:TM2 domain-containing membrane protein YozV